MLWSNSLIPLPPTFFCNILMGFIVLFSYMNINYLDNFHPPPSLPLLSLFPSKHPPFYILHMREKLGYLSSWVWLICIFFEFIQCLYMSSLADNSYHGSFEFIIWNFICFTITQVLYCGIADFWRRPVALFILLPFLLGFMHMRPSYW
jgi:hypothetical protein